MQNRRKKRLPFRLLIMKNFMSARCAALCIWSSFAADSFLDLLVVYCISSVNSSKLEFKNSRFNLARYGGQLYC